VLLIGGRATLEMGTGERRLASALHAVTPGSEAAAPGRG